MTLAILFLAAFLSTSGLATAAPRDLTEERAALDAHFQRDLEDLAEWCTKKRIFASRATVHLELIRIDPDHNVARRGLGHTKDKHGVWHENKSRMKSVDWDKKAAKEFPEKRAALKKSYLDKMYALFNAAADKLTAAERAEWEALLIATDPDDERIRKLRGEVRLEGQWVLAETARAKTRRGEIKEAVRAAIAGAPKPTPAKATAAEERLGVTWTSVLESPTARCLGTGDEAETIRHVSAAYALRELFNSCFRVQASYPQQFTIYSLANESEKAPFLAAIPGVDDTYRKYLLKLDGACLEGSWSFAQWAKSKARRVDGLVRLESAWLFTNAFEIGAQHGWALEGFGLYFTRELLGTRLTWFATPSEYALPEEDLALQQRLLDPKANWMAEANVVLNQAKRPQLGLLLGKNVNKLTTADLLYSYVLAAFLLEAESETVGPLLKLLGEGVPPEQAFESQLGLNLVDLDVRVRRWLSERK